MLRLSLIVAVSSLSTRSSGSCCVELNHPNIAAIHELAESGAARFLVLELIEDI